MQPLLQQKGLTALKPSAATDQNAFAVTKKFAQENNLDDAVRPGEAGQADQAGGARGVPQRPNCRDRPGEDLRPEDLQVLPLGSHPGQAAVLTGKADVVETGTTDATLDSQGLVLLKDDKNLQEAENIVPVVNTQKAEQPRDRGAAGQAVEHVDHG